MRREIRKGTLKELKLNQRPHGHPVPELQIITAPALILFVILLVWLKKRDTPRMVFVPTIREAYVMHMALRLFFSCRMVTSKSKTGMK